MILRKSGDTTVINQGSEGGGGGSQPSIALGPLLTSLNSEAMPSAEGYLHWTGSAWAFDTPTGGDPVDLTPYALKTWVQDNFAYKNDLVNFITKTEADGYYAALNHTHANYLPLSAGPNKALTGSLYFSGNSGINWAGGVGMLACTPESGWTGISSSQWGVGALSAQGVIRSNANDILHYRNGNSYKIWDAYNFTPSDYLPLTGGTVESLTVTNGLDADSITVGSLVNSDTLAEYLDADAMQTWGDGRYLKLTDKAGLFTQLANYDGALQITIGGTQKSLTIAYANAAGSANTAVNADKLDNHHAADFALASALGNYLPLTGGTLTGNLVMNGAGVGFGPNGYYGYIDYSNSQLRICSGAVHVQSDGVFLFNGDQIATQPWVTAQLGSYLPLTGGTVNGNLNVKGTIQAQDSNGNNKVMIYGSSGNIRAEKVYIGGSTSGYEAATHNWVASQGYQANVIETVKVAGTALTPTNKAVDIPAATSDGSTFGVVAIGTGFAFDEDRLCVAEAPITMGFKRLNKSTSETWDANTMTVNGTQYALLTNYRSTSEWANMPSGMSWGGVLQITAGSNVGYLSGQLAWDSNHNVTTGVTRKLYWRSRNSTGWGTDDWHTIAFEDWVTGQLGSYLPLTGGTLTNSLFITRTDSSVGKVSASNTNGAIELLTYSNRGVYDRTAEKWLIGTNGTSTFLLDGNVGIGTTSPAYLLDVNGNARVNGYLYFASGNSNKGTIFAAANENTLNISADNINLNTDSTGWVNINGKPINTTLFRGTGQDDDYKLTRLIMPLTTPDEFGQSYLDLSSYMPLSGDSIKNGKLAVGTTTFDGSNAKLQVGGNMFATGSITSKSSAGNVSLGNGNISATNLYISTVVFGNSNNDPAIYIGNGHVYARNSQGQTTMII